MTTQGPALAKLTRGWLALLTLTAAGLLLGSSVRDAPWLPALVAAIIWLKGRIVAHTFVESHLAHPFIARVVESFIAIPPLALLATAYFGDTLARWASL